MAKMQDLDIAGELLDTESCFFRITNSRRILESIISSSLDKIQSLRKTRGFNELDCNQALLVLNAISESLTDHGNGFLETNPKDYQLLSKGLKSNVLNAYNRAIIYYSVGELAKIEMSICLRDKDVLVRYDPAESLYWEPLRLDVEDFQMFGTPIKLSKNNVMSMHYLVISTLMLRQNKLEIASELCDTAIRLFPEYSPCYKIKGKIAEKKGDLNEAITLYRKCAELTPSDESLKVEIMNLGERIALFNKAEEILKLGF